MVTEYGADGTFVRVLASFGRSDKPDDAGMRGLAVRPAAVLLSLPRSTRPPLLFILWLVAQRHRTFTLPPPQSLNLRSFLERLEREASEHMLPCKNEMQCLSCRRRRRRRRRRRQQPAGLLLPPPLLLPFWA